MDGHYCFGIFGNSIFNFIFYIICNIWKNTDFIEIWKTFSSKLLSKIEKEVKLILATSTIVYREGNKRLDGAWMKRVRERNEAVQEIATENGYAVDDLYTGSASIPKEYRYVDGTHYLQDGYAMLAETVAECIRKELKK